MVLIVFLLVDLIAFIFQIYESQTRFAFISLLNCIIHFLATMSSNNFNHENNPARNNDMSREDSEDGGNRPSENNASANNHVYHRPARRGTVGRGYDVGYRDDEWKVPIASYIRRIDPFIGGRYPVGSNFRPGIQHNAQNHNRVFSSQTQSDHRSIIRSWLRQIFFKSEDNRRLKQSFRLVPSLLQYISWCLRNDNTPNRVTVHSVISDLGFTDPLDNPSSFFHTPEEIDRFTTFIYGLILSTNNGLPIQRTHKPVRYSKWLPKLPRDHANRILKTDDVFLVSHDTNVSLGDSPRNNDDNDAHSFTIHLL